MLRGCHVPVLHFSNMLQQMLFVIIDDRKLKVQRENDL
jgi:hypothetical protein